MNISPFKRIYEPSNRVLKSLRPNEDIQLHDPNHHSYQDIHKSEISVKSGDFCEFIDGESYKCKNNKFETRNEVYNLRDEESISSEVLNHTATTGEEDNEEEVENHD